MSFAFSAIGTRDEVLAQLPHVPTSGNAVGDAVRDLLAEQFTAESASANPGYEYRYVVKASGHSGGGAALSLNLSVEAQWVPVPEGP